jgi:hypothetical protein
MRERATLIVMAKAPRVGLGKQRLAAEIGRVEAWRINRALQAHTFHQCADARWRTLLCVTPDAAASWKLPGIWPAIEAPVAAKLNVSPSPRGGGGRGRDDAHAPYLESSPPPLTPPPSRGRGIEREPQGGGDLGQRLARALQPHRNVAVIGTDCPGATRFEIAKAFAALKRAPFALGPTADGGFWILAARDGAEAARAMAGVRWSSAHAGEDVLRNLGGRVAILKTLRDVDVAADLRAWAQRSAMRASSGS